MFEDVIHRSSVHWFFTDYTRGRRSEVETVSECFVFYFVMTIETESARVFAPITEARCFLFVADHAV